MKEDIRLNKKQHPKRLWKVHRITNDFDLWDVWHIPIKADNSKTENFNTFYTIAVKSFLMIESRKSITSFLFKIRFLIGKIFHFDKNINTLPIPDCKETSIKQRITNQDLKQDKGGKRIKSKNIGLDFPSVYLFEQESLHELSNDTVHGLVHLGWIKVDNYYTATLAIYTKPRGKMGKIYLKLIEPFRHYIVYPAIMKSIKKEWQKNMLSKEK